MFDIRWYIPKNENGTKPVLQYRSILKRIEWDETLRKQIVLDIWSEWKNVPILEEK